MVVSMLSFRTRMLFLVVSAAGALAAMQALGGCIGITQAPASIDASADAPDDVGDGAPEPSEGPAPDAGGTCHVPESYAASTSTVCMRCLQAQCCDVIAACEADAPCASLSKCVRDCLTRPDAGPCVAGCMSDHEAGLPKWDPLIRCWLGGPPKCGPDCGERR